MSDAQLNEFEQALLLWIADHTAEPALTKQVESASLKRRDYTRTGFFIYLDTDSACDPVAKTVRTICPLIQSDELFDGAGCNLFLRNGRLHYLEIYARGGFLPEQMRQFQLQPDA